MGMVQLANGNWFDEANLPRRVNPATGREETYDPTTAASSGNVAQAAPSRPNIVHGSPHPSNPNYRWDANRGQYINTAPLSVGQALTGHLQTASAQNAASNALVNALSSTQRGGDRQGRLGGMGSLNSTAGGDDVDRSGGNPNPNPNPGGQTPGPLAPGIPPSPDPSKTMLRLRGPAGDWRWSGSTGEIHDLLKQGYQAYRDNGDIQQTRPFRDGYLVDYGGGQFVPIDTVLNGRITQAQRMALTKGGYTVPEGLADADEPGKSATPGNTPPPGNTQGLAAAGYYGDQNAAGTQLPSDLQAALRQLMQESVNQGRQGQQAYSGAMDDLKNFLGFARAGAEKTMGKRDDFINSLLGKVTPGIDSAIGTMNDATGLSPEAMAALRLNATEGPERSYEQQVEQLKTQLGQRGAFGGAELPGSSGDIIRGYAPLLTSRDATRSRLLADTTLADEQRKFETLGLNRQSAANAMNAGGGLVNSVGNIYNPGAFLGANESALNSILSGVGGMNASGFAGLGQAGGFAHTIAETQPGSFRNTLLAAILRTGGDVLTNALDRRPPQSPGTQLPPINVNIGSKTPTETVGRPFNEPGGFTFPRSDRNGGFDSTSGGARSPGSGWGRWGGFGGTEFPGFNP